LSGPGLSDESQSALYYFGLMNTHTHGAFEMGLRMDNGKQDLGGVVLVSL